MAYEIPGFVFTAVSSGDVNQFRAVKINSDGKAEEVDAADTDPIAGVAQMPADDDQPEPIRIMRTGVTFAVAGAEVNPGHKIATDGDGKFVDDDGDSNIVGIALTGAEADGEFALLLV